MFEMMSGNPYLPMPDENDFKQPCGEYCLFCQKEYYGPWGMFPLLSKSGITKLLTRIFISGGVDDNGLAISALLDHSVPNGMVMGIQEVPGSWKLLFGRQITSDWLPEPVQIKKVLLLCKQLKFFHLQPHMGQMARTRVVQLWFLNYT